MKKYLYVFLFVILSFVVLFFNSCKTTQDKQKATTFLWCLSIKTANAVKDCWISANQKEKALMLSAYNLQACPRKRPSSRPVNIIKKKRSR